MHDHIAAFRIAFSHGPSAILPPPRIDLTAKASPVKCRLRNYLPEQRIYLKYFVNSLVQAGMAYPNLTTKWATAPLIVPKPGNAKFRFTEDLRTVNRFTVRHHYPMPLLENKFTKLSGSKFYANVDLSHDYWQLPLHMDSQDFQSFLIPDGAYTPTRVLHWTTNAVAHLQSALLV